ncbi:hypothetical protein O3M35_007701 [Rhynocoris fuscipes]|uniref:Uncharacterized protein n=1 Tax=Rhynocoris fuscipes TaxID=488301 RepID=A0AAW1DHL8_9HEMI
MHYLLPSSFIIELIHIIFVIFFFYHEFESERIFPLYLISHLMVSNMANLDGHILKTLGYCNEFLSDSYSGIIYLHINHV